jgi:hypothetical protein
MSYVTEGLDSSAFLRFCNIFIASKIGCSEIETPYRSCLVFFDPTHLFTLKAGHVGITAPEQGTATPLSNVVKKSPLR